MKSLTLSILFTVFSIALFAQEEEELSLNSGTIDNQFEYVIRKSNNYQQYKVIKKTWLYALKAHTLDSLKALHENLNKSQTVIDSQSKEINKLNANLSNTQNTLDKTNEEKNNMALFGMQMSKGSYNTLMWSIIIGLLGFLLFFIYKFKNSNTITREAKKSLSEVEEEFEEHRKRALEREQKVRRQLQDEINKQKNN
ncbi:tRNA (guanine-N1)-methyltransferase [Mangrovimonas spongiae]|uniref:tRNA (Guanine-N1)-methyltransferase n=1 Tax=Mangrovimonas spongiae TaxID=2494697 RepID=A0A3R9NNZ2_9FLAO|nr:tRNA (guanine-N1)-methyltransferase [Mangrovimonas spongiae]RSK38313.1 tRNA (guanine-N1)-methyltransferase [Mangrovimonas spongiae]